MKNYVFDASISNKSPTSSRCDACIRSHLVHLSICPIADDLDQLKDSCWILWEWEREIERESGDRRGSNTQGHWCFPSCYDTSAQHLNETKRFIQKQHFILSLFLQIWGVKLKRLHSKHTIFIFVFKWVMMLCSFWILHIYTSMQTLSGGPISCCYTHVSSVKSGPWQLKSYWTAPVLVIAAIWLP